MEAVVEGTALAVVVAGATVMMVVVVVATVVTVAVVAVVGLMEVTVLAATESVEAVMRAVAAVRSLIRLVTSEIRRCKPRKKTLSRVLLRRLPWRVTHRRGGPIFRDRLQAAP